MHRLIPLLVSALLCGCGDPRTKSPLLKLSVKHDNGSSVGQFLVKRTGIISGSGEGPADSAVTSGQTVMIDKIAEDGVTVTVTVFDSDAGESSKQFLVPYDKEITVSISKDATATARLERKN